MQLLTLTGRPIRTRFRCGFAVSGLTLLHTITRRFIMQEARRHPLPLESGHRAPTGCKHTVSGTISLRVSGTFHLSLTVLVHYRSLRVFSLGGWSPRIHTGYHVPRDTWDPSWEVVVCRLRGYYPLRLGFPDIFG